MNVGWNIETFIYSLVILFGGIGSYLILRLNWKRYGALFLASAIVGNILCYLFVKFGFYSYPYRLFPDVSIMPLFSVTTVFPFVVLFAVRYSPAHWPLKIPFYWVIVHLGMVGETYALEQTRIIKYEFAWDFWTSYTWWWIYLLVFEWVGSKLIPREDRKPLHPHHFSYGNLGWGILHFILIVTIFLGGFYLGRLTS